MCAQPSVLVFDVNETLIDIESIAPLFGELFGDERVLRDWFGQLVMYSMTATLAGYYVDFFTLGQGVLHMLAAIHRVNITDDDVDHLRERMRNMPAHPDVAEGLTVLRDNGFRLATLTNSPHRPGVPTPLGERRAGRLFRTPVERGYLPRLQTRFGGLSAGVRGPRCGTCRLHDGGRARVGHHRRARRRLQLRPHYPAGQSTAAG